MSEQSNTATLRQQAGRVDEGMVDAAKRGWMDHIAAHGQGVSFTDRMRAALTAALAQNTQGDGELEDLRRRNTNQAELIRELQHKLGMAVGYPNPTHAERARVPEGMAEALEALRPFANAHHRLRSYGDNPTDETPLYAYFGEGHPLYELLDGEHGSRLTVQSLEKAAAALDAAPSQRAEVK